MSFKTFRLVNVTNCASNHCELPFPGSPGPALCRHYACMLAAPASNRAEEELSATT